MRPHSPVFVLVIGMMMVAGPAAAAGKCQDVPLRVTIYNQALVESTNTFVPSAILPDANGQYIDGLSASVEIKVCSGTYDAVINVSGGTNRTFRFVFPLPIPGSVVDAMPAWVPGTFAASGGERWINVRNLTFSKQPFATMAGSTFSVPGDRATYRLGFKGQSATLPNAPNLDDPNRIAGDNIPFASSPVVVYPNYPLVCGTGSMPTWLVRATSADASGSEPQVGTLHKQPTGRGSEVHEGQYSMPFEMFIEALKCFPY